MSESSQFSQHSESQAGLADNPPPLVSIIIPNYNHGQYIGNAIQSVLDQIYQNFEIIVVDDGSTDNSREVVEGFGDRVQYIYQKNAGLSAARNTGIRAANGSVIGVLDADDLYQPEFLSTLVPILEAQPDVAAVFCGYQFVDDRLQPLPRGEARAIPAGHLFEALIDGNFLVPESILIRRSCYQRVGFFDETLTACEDWDMWLRISRDHKVIGTQKVLTRHRVLSGSMSTDPIRMLQNRLKVVEKNFGPEPAVDSAWTPELRRALGHAYLTSCIEYLQYNDKKRAYEFFRKMASILPELLTEKRVFYELACGDQPKGFRGHFQTLNISANAQVLFDYLDQLFVDIPLLQGRYRRPAYATAYLVLGLLSYGASMLPETRTYLISAIVKDIRVGFKRQVLMTLLKSLLGSALINQVRAQRNRLRVKLHL